MQNFELLIPLFGVLMPVLLIWVIFYYNTESDKNKYNAIIEVSKNIKDSEEIKEILESLAERKKTSTDLRKTGLVTIFVGIGLSGFRLFWTWYKYCFWCRFTGYVYWNWSDVCWICLS